MVKVFAFARIPSIAELEQMLRRIPLLFTCTLLFCAATKAQINVGLGYQLGYFKMENADKPVDRFNQSGFLAKEMGHFRLPGGEIYLASIRHNRLLLELNLNTRRARSSAESYSGSVLNRRDIRFSMQGIGFGAGYAVVDQPSWVLYAAGAFDLGYMRLSTRLAPKQNVGSTPYYLVHRNGMMALTLYSKFVFRSDPEAITSWSLTPYFHFPLKNYDFWHLNTILFPPTQWNVDGTTLPARPWNIGIALNFDIDLIRLLL